ncbi:MAG: ribonuclease III domain-containing protein [Mycoplasma sp.]
MENTKYIKLANELGLNFKNIENFKQAFYIKKIATVNGNSKDNYSNAGIATLGDSVLKVYVSIRLYEKGINERGKLTKLKEKIEDNSTLLNISNNWNLHLFVFDEYGGVENRDPAKQIPNSLKLRSTLVEAIIGSLFIDQGIEKTFDILRESSFLSLINQKIAIVV